MIWFFTHICRTRGHCSEHTEGLTACTFFRTSFVHVPKTLIRDLRRRIKIQELIFLSTTSVDESNWRKTKVYENNEDEQRWRHPTLGTTQWNFPSENYREATINKCTHIFFFSIKIIIENIEEINIIHPQPFPAPKTIPPV